MSAKTASELLKCEDTLFAAKTKLSTLESVLFICDNATDEDLEKACAVDTDVSWLKKHKLTLKSRDTLYSCPNTHLNNLWVKYVLS
jgi:hypothetical protein